MHFFLWFPLIRRIAVIFWRRILFVEFMAASWWRVIPLATVTMDTVTVTTAVTDIATRRDGFIIVRSFDRSFVGSVCPEEAA